VENQGPGLNQNVEGDDTDSSESSEDTTLSEVIDDDIDSKISPEGQNDEEEDLAGNPPFRDNGEILQRVPPSMVSHYVYKPRKDDNPYKTLIPIPMDGDGNLQPGAQV
jgi:hypothetical protein